MYRKLMSRRQSDEAFTLIELLVVLLILGILTAIAVPFALSQEKSRQRNLVRQDVTSTVQAVKDHLLNYPTATTASLAQGNTRTGTGDGRLAKVQTGEAIVTIAGNWASWTVTGRLPGDTWRITYRSDIGGGSYVETGG